MKDYKLYFFDFDYTLGDTTEAIVRSINYGLKQMGHAEATEEAIRATIGLTLEEAYFVLTGVPRTEEEEKNSHTFHDHFMVEANICMTASARLYDYTLPSLRRIKEKGGKTAIVTTKYKFRIEQIFEKFNSSELIDIIVGSDTVKNPKPDPESVEYVLKELNTSPEDAVYIGDSEVDAKTAKAGGIDFIGVLTGTTKREELQKYDNIDIFNDLGEFYNEYLA